MWTLRVPRLGGWRHFVDGVAAVGGVDGAGDGGAVLLQVIQLQDALFLIQCCHNRLRYAPLVEACTWHILVVTVRKLPAAGASSPASYIEFHGLQGI